MRLLRSRLACTVAVLAPLVAVTLIAAPAQARGDDRAVHAAQVREAAGAYAPLASSPNVEHVKNLPGSAGISGCFLQTKPLFVVSNIDSIKVYDVRRPLVPKLVGTLPNILFENEAMNCGERVTSKGTQRFALVGVDIVQATPGDIQHANLGGGELIVVDVTDPTNPHVRSRAPGTTSTHTLACVTPGDCRFAYSAGSGDHFSIFDLRRLDHPRELDSDKSKPGVQPFKSPTAGHKWNFDNAGYATHTGWNGTSLWNVKKPQHPRFVTGTGAAGRGTDPKYKGYNDFVHHNSFRPNAKKFKPMAAPSVKNGNVLFITEEDYEQTDCTKAGSFQTWWVKRLNGRKGQIVPLDKVELSDLGTFNVPQFAFCSAHWFDYHSSGIVATGFYGGGTQYIDVRDPRNLKPYGHASWGGSETWDAMWVPHYRANGKMTNRKTNATYAIDLVRGLDVYRVDLPGSNNVKLMAAQQHPEGPPAGLLVGLGILLAGVLGLHRRAASAQRRVRASR